MPILLVVPHISKSKSHNVKQELDCAFLGLGHIPCACLGLGLH